MSPLLKDMNKIYVRVESYTKGDHSFDDLLCDMRSVFVRVDILEKQNKKYLVACESALKYDQAIFYNANKGKSWVQSDQLDKLYDDWITKAKQALSLQALSPNQPSEAT